MRMLIAAALSAALLQSLDGRAASSAPLAAFIDALGFPAVIVPIVKFDNNQRDDNENLRLGTFFDGIVTLAAVVRL